MNVNNVKENSITEVLNSTSDQWTPASSESRPVE